VEGCGMKNEDASKIIHKHLSFMSEHFDTVQIFVTHHNPTTDEYGTMNISIGTGNWIARYGQVKDWINRIEEAARHEKRKSMDSE
jgi:hypothetical protein